MQTECKIKMNTDVYKYFNIPIHRCFAVCSGNNSGGGKGLWANHYLDYFFMHNDTFGIKNECTICVIKRSSSQFEKFMGYVLGRALFNMLKSIS